MEILIMWFWAFCAVGAVMLGLSIHSAWNNRRLFRATLPLFIDLLKASAEAEETHKIAYPPGMRRLVNSIEMGFILEGAGLGEERWADESWALDGKVRTLLNKLPDDFHDRLGKHDLDEGQFAGECIRPEAVAAYCEAVKEFARQPDAEEWLRPVAAACEG